MFKKYVDFMFHPKNLEEFYCLPKDGIEIFDFNDINATHANTIEVMEIWPPSKTKLSKDNILSSC